MFNFTKKWKLLQLFSVSFTICGIASFIGSSTIFAISPQKKEKAAQKEDSEINSLLQLLDNAKESEDFEIVRLTLKRLFELTLPNTFDTQKYFTLRLEQIKVEIDLENFVEAQNVINQFFTEDPPEAISFKAHVLQALVLYKQGNFNQAYDLIYKQKLQFSSENWSEEDLLILQAIEDHLNEYYGNLLLQAEKLIQVDLYEEASFIYEEAWLAIQKNNFPAALLSNYRIPIISKVKYRLGECLYHIGDFKKIIALFDANPISNLWQQSYSDELYVKIIYAVALAYLQSEDYNQAIEGFEYYLQLMQQNHKHEIEVEAYWNLGWSFYQIGKEKKALQIFEDLGKTSDSHLQILSILYQAKIFFNQGAYDKTDGLLSILISSLNKEDPLRYECFYLKGQIAFRQKEYLITAEYFEKAIPQRNANRANWYPDLLYNLGSCYLKLSQQVQLDILERKQFIQKAKIYLDKLQGRSDYSLKVNLALGQIYLLNIDEYSSEQIEKEVLNLVGDLNKYSDLNEKAEALLLQARATLSKSDQKIFYEELIHSKYKDTILYPEAWYHYGLYLLNTGRDLLQKEDLKHEALINFENSVEALKQAYFLAKKDSLFLLAAMANFQQAKVYLIDESTEKSEQAFNLLHNLKQDKVLYGAFIQKDLFLYWYGKVAYRLATSAIKPSNKDYILIALNSLEQLAKEHPYSSLLADTLYSLGKIYYEQANYLRSEQFFTLAAEKFLQKQKLAEVGDCYFFIALAAQKSQKELTVVQEYFKKVFIEYPDSKYAPESFFRYYPFSEYIQNNEESLNHLMQLEIRYPNSLYNIFLYYFKGLHLKQTAYLKGNEDEVSNLNQQVLTEQELYEDAIKHFEKAKNYFDKVYPLNSIDNKQFLTFIETAYHSLLQKALIKLLLSEKLIENKKQFYLDTSIQTFLTIINAFKQAKDPGIKRWLTLRSYPRIFEESEYGLTQAYIKANKNDIADKILIEMLDKYSCNQIKEGYYLSRVWYDRGRIAMQRKDYSSALEHFQNSENSAKKDLLTIEQKLELWLQEGLCYKYLQQYDLSMRTLSKLINEESTSSLRIEAMFIRAEIYEAQGRSELAIKQLEAIIKQGGLAAKKAQEKLEKEYAFN